MFVKINNYILIKLVLSIFQKPGNNSISTAERNNPLTQQRLREPSNSAEVSKTLAFFFLQFCGCSSVGVGF